MAFPTRVWLMESRLGGGGAWDGGEGMVFFPPSYQVSLLTMTKKMRERVRPRKPWKQCKRCDGPFRHAARRRQSTAGSRPCGSL